MKLDTSRTAIVVAVLFLAGCQTTVELPSNVTTVAGTSGQGTYVDKADFSFDASSGVAFAALKLCIAETVQNQAVQLRDGAGSFVGPATGTYYRANNVQTQGGGEIFKYSDDSLSTLIATGTTMAAPSTMGLVQDIVRFDLKASVKGSRVGLLFQNVTRAQQNTGAAANTGFGPVGAWPGARAPDVVAALEAVAAKIRGCAK